MYTFDYLLSRAHESELRRSYSEYEIAIVNPYQEFTVKCWFSKERKKQHYFVVVVVVTKKGAEKTGHCYSLFLRLIGKKNIFLICDIYFWNINYTKNCVCKENAHRSVFISIHFLIEEHCRVVSFSCCCCVRFFHLFPILVCIEVWTKPSFEFHWVSVHKRHVMYIKESVPYHTDTYCKHMFNLSGQMHCMKWRRLCISILRQKNFARANFSFMTVASQLVRRWECVCVILYVYIFSLYLLIRLYLFLLNRDSRTQIQMNNRLWHRETSYSCYVIIIYL